MTIAVERARQYGVGIVAVRHGFHFGTARRYAIQAAKADCIGIVTCNTRPLMPAPGGAERVVGNNPLAIAVPSDGPIPDRARHGDQRSGHGQDQHGGEGRRGHPAVLGGQGGRQSDHDAREAIAGMLLPSAGPKGFGLSFMIDLLCGLLSGGASGDAREAALWRCRRAVRLVAPVPGDRRRRILPIRQWCDAAAAAAAERIRAGKRAPGVAQLFAPGEPEWRKREQRRRSGHVDAGRCRYADAAGAANSTSRQRTACVRTKSVPSRTVGHAEA